MVAIVCETDTDNVCAAKTNKYCGVVFLQVVSQRNVVVDHGEKLPSSVESNNSSDEV